MGNFDLDWIQGVNWEKLRGDRLAKLRKEMAARDVEAFIAMTPPGIRYCVGSIGMALPKVHRYVVLGLTGEPILFELATDSLRVKQCAPWVKDVRLAIPIDMVPASALPDWGKQIRSALNELGVRDGKVGIDMITFGVLDALRGAGVKVVDGWPALL